MSQASAQDSAFASRLFDLLSTLEATAVIGLAKSRVRGLGEQLAFGATALSASVAVAALETSATTHLHLPVVATPQGHREVDLDVPFEGTLFSHALSGGGSYAVSLEPNDELILPLAPLLQTAPSSALILPIRLGDHTAGAIAFLRSDTPFLDESLELAERFASVVALTVEAFFTERVLFELFATSLPELLGKDAATSLPQKLLSHLRTMRVSPEYRARLDLALAIGRITSRTPLEARLAKSVLLVFEQYIRALEGGSD